MDRELVYRISAAGQAETIRAIKSITEATRETAAAEVNLAKVTAQAKARARKTGADAEKRAAAELAREEARYLADSLKKQLDARNREVKETEKAEKAKAKAVAEGEKAKTRAADREAKEREKAADRAGKAIVREMNRQVREHEKAEREKTRKTEEETRKQEQALKRMARETARETRELFRTIGPIAQGALKGASRMVGGMLSAGVGGIASGLGLDRGYDIGSIVSERMLVAKKVRQIAIENRMPGQDFGAFDEAAAQKKIQAAAVKTGISQTELVGALDVFSEKGLGAQGLQDIDKVARQAMALGTDPAVVAKLRAQLAISSGQAGKEMTSEQIDAAIAKISFLGKHGVFRAADIANQSESLFSRFTASGGDLVGGLDRFVGFAEIARSATGGAAQAKTAIGQVQNAIVKKEGAINALGIKTREDDGTQSDFVTTMMDVIQKTGGHGATFNKIFDTRAMGAVNPFVSAFMNAGGATDAVAGRKAMEALLQSTQVKGASVAEMEKDAAHAMESDGNQIAKSLEQVRASIGDAIAPALAKVAKSMPEIANKISGVVEWMSQHPLLALTLAGGAGALGGGMAGGAGALWSKAGQAIAGLGGSIGGTAGGFLKAGGDMASQASAVPVYVTNMPAGGFGGGGGVPGAPGGAPGAGGLGPIKGPGDAAAVIAAGVAGFNAGKYLVDGKGKDTAAETVLAAMNPFVALGLDGEGKGLGGKFGGLIDKAAGYDPNAESLNVLKGGGGATLAKHAAEGMRHGHDEDWHSRLLDRPSVRTFDQRHGHMPDFWGSGGGDTRSSRASDAAAIPAAAAKGIDAMNKAASDAEKSLSRLASILTTLNAHASALKGPAFR